MKQHIEEFLAYLKLERGLSATTLSSYRHDLQLFARFLEKRGLASPAQVQPAHVREFLQGLRAAQRTPATIARKLSAVKGLFKFLEGQRTVTDSPTAFIESPRLWRRLPPTLSAPASERRLGGRRGWASGRGGAGGGGGGGGWWVLVLFFFFFPLFFF